ncbi:MAG: glycoside hydrolase family 32 protein, partial [SAR202 cluster bacterium]|nr:glycoside hydrolase family 32 protein [SAR202 cluster bacterium]
DPDVTNFQAAREHLASDSYRPIYHFTPPGSIMNDPNGLCQWQGRYHLFYQYRPSNVLDRVHWGHTVSDDLIHWQDLPIALYPDKEKDCYSGQTLVEPGRVIAIYHGTESGNSIATASDPLLLNWEKHPENPVIPIVPIDENGSSYRVFDPAIWKEDDGYYAISGTYKNGDRGDDAVGVDHLFRSTDLAEWEYLGPLMEDSFHAEPGEDAAVPNFWPIGNGKHMLLLFSHKRAGRYYIGDYDETSHRFVPDYHGRMNYGPWTVGSLHAPSATIDDSGRYLAFFNVKEGKPADGWDNIMTLPRHFSLREDDSLSIEPAPEVESLRFDHRSVDATDIPANGEIVLDGITGKAMEIEATIEPGEAREVGLCVLRSPDGAERTRISYYPQDHRRFNHSSLQIDVSESSLRSDVFARTPEIGPIELDESEPLRLRIFIDRSIVEVFANGRQCLTIRTYPEREDSNCVSIFARGANAKLVSLDSWQMRSVWPELSGREGA